MDIPGVLTLLQLLACGHEVTERVAEGALQKAECLKWLRLCTWTMAKGYMPEVTYKDGLVMTEKRWRMSPPPRSGSCRTNNSVAITSSFPAGCASCSL